MDFKYGVIKFDTDISHNHPTLEWLATPLTREGVEIDRGVSIQRFVHIPHTLAEAWTGLSGLKWVDNCRSRSTGRIESRLLKNQSDGRVKFAGFACCTAAEVSNRGEIDNLELIETGGLSKPWGAADSVDERTPAMQLRISMHENVREGLDQQRAPQNSEACTSLFC